MGTTAPEPLALLEVAREATAAAVAAIEPHWRRGATARSKADGSPVTDADVDAERAIRAVIARRFPAHAVFGEELGHQEGHDATRSEFLWLVDPIDGTKSFVRRYEMFSVQVCVWQRGVAQAAVSAAPWFGETAWAARGAGAWLADAHGEQRLAVSAVDALERAALSTGNLRSLAQGPAWPAFGRLVAQVDRIRGYGDFWHYHLLAKGSVDAVIESDLNILDVAALALIVEEAGGRITTLAGRPLALDSRDIIASNGVLHDALLGAVRP
jgi:histidinol-phosphatase